MLDALPALAFKAELAAPEHRREQLGRTTGVGQYITEPCHMLVCRLGWELGPDQPIAPCQLADQITAVRFGQTVHPFFLEVYRKSHHPLDEPIDELPIAKLCAYRRFHRTARFVEVHDALQRLHRTDVSLGNARSELQDIEPAGTDRLHRAMHNQS